MAGTYHLPGEVQVCSDEIFKKLWDTVQPLFDCVPGHYKGIFPQQPRYMFAPCCDAKDHCTNLTNPSHQDILLGGNLRLRALLKKFLCESQKEKFWVADTCMQVRSVRDKAVPERVSALKTVSATDGVHYTLEGYRTVAKNVAEIVRDFESGKQGKNPLFGRRSAASFVTGASGRFFWRGFCSPVGSCKRPTSSASSKFAKNRPHKSHFPYRRGSGRKNS